MNCLLFSIRLLKSVKVDLIIVIIYSTILTFYSINWNVINPFEFVLYTKYFVYPGFIIWCIFSSKYHHYKIFKNIPLYWLELNNLYSRPKKVNINIVMYSLIIFLLFLLINGVFISAIITLSFSSGFMLFLYLFKSYLVYYFLTFAFAWILGIYFAYLINFSDKSRQITYLTTTIIILFLITYIDYSKNFNLIINWRNHFIHPILNFGYSLEGILLKITLIITFTMLLILIVNLKKSIAITFSSILIILSFILIPILGQNDLESALQSNDRVLQKKLDNRVNTTKQLNESWVIENIQLLPGDKTPIKVKINNLDKKNQIYFSLNEQFTISEISYRKKDLEYSREGNIVRVKANGAPDITVLYDETIGTSIYPLLENITILPFQSNWYPQKIDIKHYDVDRLGNIEPNAKFSSCDDLLISKKSTMTWDGKQSECLSIIDGPFYNFALDDIEFMVYIPFLTKRDNYLDLINDIYRIKEGICELSKEGHCSLNETIKSISIIPKSLSSSTISVLDTVDLNGHYIFNVNLFTDVGYKPITNHLSEFMTVQLSYRMLKDDKLSIFFGQYLIEHLNIETNGYIDLMVDKYEIDKEKWDEYKSLDISNKKKRLRNFLN